MPYIFLLCLLLIGCLQATPPPGLTPPPTVPSPPVIITLPAPSPTPARGLTFEVYWRTEADAEWHARLTEACEVWNLHLGRSVFAAGGLRLPVDLADLLITSKQEYAAGIYFSGPAPSIQVLRHLQGRNRLLVLLHELGHHLGMGHSSVTGSVMAPVLDPLNTILPSDVTAAREAARKTGLL